MAHQITDTDATFFVQEPAWHGLGLVLDDAPSDATVAASIAFARRDGKPGAWSLAKQPLFVPDGTMVPDHFAVVRTDTRAPLGVVGSKYAIVQPAELFAAAQPLLNTGRWAFETGGSLMGGATTWGLLKSKALDLGAGDVIQPYLRLDADNTGRRAVELAPTATRIVCANTLAIARAEKVDAFKIRHTASAGLQLEEAGEAIARAERIDAQTIAEAQLLIRRRVSKAETEAYFAHLIPDTDTERGTARAKNTRTTLVQALDRAPGAQLATARGTAWGMYQAATWYASHGMRPDADADTRTSALWYGSARELIERARVAALAVAA